MLCSGSKHKDDTSLTYLCKSNKTLTMEPSLITKDAAGYNGEGEKNLHVTDSYHDSEGHHDKKDAQNEHCYNTEGHHDSEGYHDVEGHLNGDNPYDGECCHNDLIGMILCLIFSVRFTDVLYLD